MTRHLRMAGFLASALLIFALACAKPPALTLRVMTFNVRYDNPDDAPNDWPQRRQTVALTLPVHNIDLAGLQEALHHQLTELAAALPQYGWIGAGRDDGAQKGEYTPIFYRKERLQLQDQGLFWLSTKPDSIGSVGWDAALPRIATWGKFRDRRSGKTFVALNTHLDHMGETARRQSADLILRRLSQLAPGMPIFVTGDMNSARQDSAYLRLTDPADGLQDTELVAIHGHYGGAQTFNGFRESLHPGRIIDFVLVRGTGRVLYHATISERGDGRFVSDHYPVFAEVELD